MSYTQVLFHAIAKERLSALPIAVKVILLVQTLCSVASCGLLILFLNREGARAIVLSQVISGCGTDSFSPMLENLTARSQDSGVALFCMAAALIFSTFLSLLLVPYIITPLKGSENETN